MVSYLCTFNPSLERWPLFHIVLSLLDQHTATQVCLSFPAEMSRLIQPRRELFLTFSSKNLGAGGAGSSHGSQQVPASDSLPRPEALHEAFLAWILLKRCSTFLDDLVVHFSNHQHMLGYLLVCESLLVLGDALNHQPGYLKHSAFFWMQQSFSASDKDWLVVPHFCRGYSPIAKLKEWHPQIDISILTPHKHILTITCHEGVCGQISVCAWKGLAEHLVPMTHEPPENSQVLKRCPFVLDWNREVGFSNSQASRKLGFQSSCVRLFLLSRVPDNLQQLLVTVHPFMCFILGETTRSIFDGRPTVLAFVSVDRPIKDFFCYYAHCSQIMSSHSRIAMPIDQSRALFSWASQVGDWVGSTISKSTISWRCPMWTWTAFSCILIHQWLNALMITSN